MEMQGRNLGTTEFNSECEREARYSFYHLQPRSKIIQESAGTCVVRHLIQKHSVDIH